MTGRLRELRDALDAIAGQWSDWKRIEAWASCARPIILQAFPTHAAQFETLVTDPRWIQICIHATSGPDDDEGIWRARQRVEERENDRFAAMRKQCILDFLDDLARLDAHNPMAE